MIIWSRHTQVKLEYTSYDEECARMNKKNEERLTEGLQRSQQKKVTYNIVRYVPRDRCLLTSNTQRYQKTLDSSVEILSLPASDLRSIDCGCDAKNIYVATAFLRKGASSYLSYNLTACLRIWLWLPSRRKIESRFASCIHNLHWLLRWHFVDR
ncbi:hypothetical protein KI387_016035, partial [Taxus chinensis]